MKNCKTGGVSSFSQGHVGGWERGVLSNANLQVLNSALRSQSVSVKLSAADFGLLSSTFFHLFLGVSGSFFPRGKKKP